MILKYDGVTKWGAFVEEDDEESHVDEVVVIMRNGTWIRIEERAFNDYILTVTTKENE